MAYTTMPDHVANTYVRTYVRFLVLCVTDVSHVHIYVHILADHVTECATAEDADIQSIVIVFA